MTEAPTPMAAPTLVLIAGYARAGKDTLASGIKTGGKSALVTLCVGVGQGVALELVAA